MGYTEIPLCDTLKIFQVGSITPEMSYLRALKDSRMCIYLMVDMETWVWKMWIFALLLGLVS